jgi:acylpyruvate hydrolase
MKLVTFKVHTEERLGALFKDRIVDLNSAYALYLKEVEKRESAPRLASAVIPPSMTDFLEGGEESLNAAKKTLDFINGKEKADLGLDGEKIFLSSENVRLSAPVPRPGKIYCLAVNYYDHATERIREPDKRQEEINRLKSLKLNVPVVFQKAPCLIVGPDAPIIKPRTSNRLDYECELAVVIGKKGKYIPAEKAYEYIGGYTIFNDVSFRDQGWPKDVQWNFYTNNMNWLKGKGMDNAAPMGPYLVTRDDIPDPYSPPLRLITRVNGQVRQNGNTSTMIIGIPRLIEYFSDGVTLEPGDVIATGTVAGVASGHEDLSWFLNVGDLVENEIQPMGVQKHIVIGD